MAVGHSRLCENFRLDGNLGAIFIEFYIGLYIRHLSRSLSLSVWR